MPRHRIGPIPLSPAERQARRRTKLRRQIPGPPATPSRRISRGQNDGPRRWPPWSICKSAWLDNLPPNLESSPLAHKLQAIAELDLEELQAIEPPRGYGRD